MPCIPGSRFSAVLLILGLALAYHGRGLSRGADAAVIAEYLAFVTALVVTVETRSGPTGSDPPGVAPPRAGGVVLGPLLLAWPADVRGRLPSYVSDGCKKVRAVLILLPFGKIVRTTLSIGIGGSGGRVRVVSVHRCHLRHGVRRHRGPSRRGRGK